MAEYVESRDARAASRRLVALHVPFYHHELVRRALVTAVEESRAKPRVAKRVTELLAYLGAAGVVSGTQFAKGFARVAVALKELVLDTPDAQEVFERLVAGAKAKGLLPAGLSAWASFRVGGDASHARRMDDGGASAAGATPALTERLTERAPRAGRARGGRGGGHLMRLDSAPDLIALARSLKTAHAREEPRRAPPGERAPPLANGAARGPGPGSPLKGSGSGRGIGTGIGTGPAAARAARRGGRERDPPPSPPTCPAAYGRRRRRHRRLRRERARFAPAAALRAAGARQRGRWTRAGPARARRRRRRFRPRARRCG